MSALLDPFRRNLFFLRSLAVGLLALAWSPAAFAEGAPTTLWLTRPLYPGQESLVGRTEAALRNIFPPEALGGELIGRGELAKVLEGRPLELGCILGETACPDPAEALVAGLGVGRVVLLKAGQDESGYRFRAVSWMLGGEPVVGEGQGAQLDKALLSALVKVVPVNATLEVASMPPGAAVFVDGERVGLAPVSLQLLPGEHAVKLELPSHLPVEARVTLVARGRATLSRSLEKVPARLVVEALPQGVAISVDGQPSGTDKLDRGIQPGAHTVALSLEGHVPYEEKLDIAPGATARIQRALSPTTWFTVQSAMARAQDEEAARRLYFSAAWESGRFTSTRYVTALDGSLPRVDSLVVGQLPELRGVSAEVGLRWRFGGLALFGLSVLTSGDVPVSATFERDVEGVRTAVQEDAQAQIQMVTVRFLQPQLQLLLWRFALGLQGGLATRGGVFYLNGNRQLFVAGASPATFDGLLLEGQARLRFTVLGGLFLEGAGRFSAPVTSSNSPILSFQAGLGYAFQ